LRPSTATAKRTVTTLAGHANFLEIDWSTHDYPMVLDGVDVARAGATFCPLGADRIALYTMRDETLSATLPAGWQPAQVQALALFPDRTEPVAFDIKGQTVAVAMQSRVPVLLSRRTTPNPIAGI
jgi:hypothetical protein